MHKSEFKINPIALERTLYVLCAGAFGVFVRWIQRQAAFDENGLVNRSVWNVLVPAVMIAAFLVFRGIVKQYRKEGRTLSTVMCEAFSTDGRIYDIAATVIGAVMGIGSLLLFLTCETDPDAGFLKVLSLSGFAAGVCFTLFAHNLKYEDSKPGLMCLYSAVPVLMYAVWLLTAYKMNDINSVVWDYGVEIIALCTAMFAAFYVAGYAFSYADPWRTMLFNMLAAFLLLMSLADERYTGMQLMFLAQALMFIYYNWVMLENMSGGKKKEKAQVYDGGFDRL